MRLEALAKKVDAAEKGTITLILGRFHIHTGQPKLAAALILKLVHLSTKEEESILDKEHKLIKNFRPDNEASKVFEAGDFSHGGTQACAFNFPGARPNMLYSQNQLASPMSQYPVYMPSPPTWFQFTPQTEA